MSGAPTEDTQTPFWAKCVECGHAWIAAHYPIDLRIFGRQMGKTHCPSCNAGPKRIRIAKQDKGVLQE